MSRDMDRSRESSSRRALVSRSNRLLVGLLAVLVVPTVLVAQTSVDVLWPYHDLLLEPLDMVHDSAGNAFVAGAESNNLFRIAPEGSVTLLASYETVLPGAFVTPKALAVDSQDNLYVACAESHNVFRFAPGGGVSVVLDIDGDGVGNGLLRPETLVVDSADEVWVAGYSSDTVFRLSPGGAVTLVLDAGGLEPAHLLDEPRVDLARGAVFISGTGGVIEVGSGGALTEILGAADVLPHLIRDVLDVERNTDGRVLVALRTSGSQFPVFVITPGRQVQQLSVPSIAYDLGSDSLGSLWLLGTSGLLELPAAGGVVTRATPDAGTTFQSLVIDGSDNVLWVNRVSGDSDALFRRTPAGVIETVIDSTGATDGTLLENGQRAAVLSDGTVLVAGKWSGNVLRVDPQGIVGVTVEGLGWNLAGPTGVDVDQEGRVVVTTLSSSRVLRLGETFADAEALADYNGAGLDPFFNPRHSVTDSSGNVFALSTFGINLIRISPAGDLTQIYQDLWTGTFGLAVDVTDQVIVANGLSVLRFPPTGAATTVITASGDGTGNAMATSGPVTTDGAGNVYAAGRASDNVFRITPGGVITQIVDAAGAGPGAPLDGPSSLAATWDGHVYVAGEASSNVLHVTPNGVVTEILNASGTGTGVGLDSPVDVEVDAFGTVYVVGRDSDNVFRVDPQGNVKFILNAVGAGPHAKLDEPLDATLDGSGTLFVACEGTDNVLAVHQSDWWTDLAGAAPGLSGHPELRVKGPLTPGSKMDLVLTRVPAATPMLAWVSFASNPFSALGGTVHAFPFGFQVPFVSGATGRSALAFNWPGGIAPGIDITLQYIVQDLSVPAGLTLSNAVTKTTP